MDQKAGAQISTRAFIQSLLILFLLMLAAGILTRVIPTGSYTRIEEAGRELIDPATFQYTSPPDYPVWRWFTAPLETLWGPDGLTIIIIILFLLMIGSSFAILDKSGLMKAALARIVNTYAGRKYQLLWIVSLFFMTMGAFFGIFEEVVPLVPLMLGLSYFLGWDALVGLGMSILAVNMGFSAAITNPFTIGVAQNIAGLPLFSGAWFRVLIFITIYLVYTRFLTAYARKIEKEPQTSPVYLEDQAERAKYDRLDVEKGSQVEPTKMRRAMTWLAGCLLLILLILILGPLTPAISSVSLPVVGLLFFIAGIGASLLSGASISKIRQALLEGIGGIAPAIPLILMAASIKHIVANGGILDTILHNASQAFSQASPFVATLIIYFLALFIEFFIGSGSAKAFLVMPIILPLADLVGVTRQVAVTAYCFGDGFSNMVYPTNAVLLISLGLTTVGYSKWLRWTWRLWLGILLVTIIFLGVGVAIQFGPF